MNTKTCTQCSTAQPLDAFSKFRHSRDGLSPWCKACHRAYNAEYRARPENREKAREAAAAWRAADPERARASEVAYRARNPHVRWESGYRVRARQYGVPVVVEHFTKSDVIERHGDACAHCGGPFEELDHQPPVALGGTHTLDTVRPSCRPCNRADTGVRTKAAS